MSNFNALMRGEKIPPASVAGAIIDDGDVINLKYIINNKPKVKIVRDFMRANLEGILSAEQELFQL